MANNKGQCSDLSKDALQEVSDAAEAAPSTEARDLALRAVREHNFSMPLVPGQILKGSVIRVDRRTVWLDVGLAKHAKFFR